jgi:hypothetical protein
MVVDGLVPFEEKVLACKVDSNEMVGTYVLVLDTFPLSYGSHALPLQRSDEQLLPPHPEKQYIIDTVISKYKCYPSCCIVVANSHLMLLLMSH